MRVYRSGQRSHPGGCAPGQAEPGHLTPTAVRLLSLQRSAGNAAVAAALAGRPALAAVQRCGPDNPDCGCDDLAAQRLAGAAVRPVQRTIGDGHDLTSPRFARDVRLEACYDDQARLSLGATGASVVKVQQALIELGYGVGPSGANGVYGQQTWDAVKDFKKTEQLGWEQMGDVGPGTMRRLNELFPGKADDLPPCPADIDDDSTAAVNVSAAAANVGAAPGAGLQIPGVTCKLGTLPPSGGCPQGKQPKAIVNDCGPSQPVDKSKFIKHLKVDVGGHKVTATWTDGSKDVWDCSANPGVTPKGDDKVGVKCTVDHTNHKRDGMAWFTGFAKEFLRIGFHDSQPVGTAFTSHGCVRVRCAEAKIINQNTGTGVTTIKVI